MIDLEFHKQVISRYLKESQTKKEFQKVLCVWLRVTLSLTSEQIALALGMTAAAVRQVHLRYFKRGAPIFGAHHGGGRTRAYLDINREQRLVKTFLMQARHGRALDVDQLHRSFELSAGRRVSRSTIYRLIERHGMRRFLPRARARKKTT